MEAPPHNVMPKSGIDAERLLAQGAWMRSLARGLVADRGLAEDVVQEAYHAALSRPPADGGGRGLRPWLAAVVGNLARRTRNREARRPSLEARAPQREPAGSGAELVERMELQRLLAEAVLALDEPARGAVLMRHLEGLGAREIGRRQGCTPAAARQRVARGLAALRRSLDGRCGRRSAWAALVAPLAGRPLALSGLTSSLTGVLMGLKQVALVVAGLSLGTFMLLRMFEGGAEVHAPAAAALALALAPAAEDGAAEDGAAEDGGDLIPAERSPGVRESLTRSDSASMLSLELTGIVHDVAGRPLAAALLVACAAETEAEALVASEEQPARVASSGPAGRFQLSLDGALQRTEELSLWAFCDGYMARRVVGTQGTPLDVLLHAWPSLEVRLHPPGSVALDAPSKATIWVERGDGTLEELALALEGPGRLVARNLPLGRVVRVHGRMRGSATAERALDLELRPDHDERVELELGRGALIRGIVLDERTDEPIGGAEVWAERGQLSRAGTSPVTRADGQGRFELVGVDMRSLVEEPIHWVVLSASAPGYTGKVFDARSWQPTPDETYEAELRLRPAIASFEGRAVLPDGSAARVHAMAVDGRGRILSCRSNAQGVFLFDDLSRGSFELLVYTDSRHAGESRAALRAGFEILEAEARSEELVLDLAAGSVEGRLLDTEGRGLEGLELRLNLNLRTSGLAFSVESRVERTDAQGRFLFAGAHAGNYDWKILTSPEGLVAGPGPGNFDLEPGETRTIELSCVPPIELAGSVDLGALDPTRLRVVARAASNGARLDHCLVAADGSFRLPRLYPFEIELTLEEQGSAIARLQAGPHSARDLLLRPKE